MRMAETTHLKDLKPNPQNARMRTERSASLIERSIERYGCARSIVIDEDGTILCGHGTVEAAASLGIERVKIVEGDGNTLIAVRRKGLDETQKAGLAIADNRASDLSEFNVNALLSLPKAALDISFSDSELEGLKSLAERGDESEKAPLTCPSCGYVFGSTTR